MNILKKALNTYKELSVAAKSTIWILFCNVLQKSFSLLTTPIFTRMMTTEQYGQVSMFFSWFQIVAIIVTLRLNYDVFNKGMSLFREDRDGYVSTMQMLTAVIAGVMLLVYSMFSDAINTVTDLPDFIMVALLIEFIVYPSVDFWVVRQRYEYNYRPVVAVVVSMSLLNALVGVLAVFLFREKGYARILAIISVEALFGLVLFAYNGIKAKWRFVGKYAIFAIGFNLPLIPHYLSVYVLEESNKILIKYLQGFGAVGIYSVAYSAGMIMKILTQSLSNALIPWVYTKLEEREYRSMGNNQMTFFGLVGGCALLYSLFAPELLWILADDKYYEAIYAIPPIALSVFFIYIYTIFTNIEFYYDCNKFTTLISFGITVENVILGYWGIRLFGYVGAAYATMICYVTSAFVHYLYMNAVVTKKTGISDVFGFKRLLFLSALLVMISALIVSLYDKIVIRYSLILIVSIAAFLKRNEILQLIRSIKTSKA